MNTRMSRKLATRASPLAIAQSRVVARALEQRHPGLDIELVPVKTRGDFDTSTPLHQVMDADFFSAQLDRLLLSDEVDFCVHSRKDLSDHRPSGITLAAIPRRENPRDAVIFNAQILHKLQSGTPIQIGSSSLRRTKNVGEFLQTTLPSFGAPAKIQFADLRGPVHERLSRIHQDTESDGYLDGVVLALSGLNRLYVDTDGYSLVAPLLRNVRWMILPLSECPAAPGQGALAIECRSNDVQMRNFLRSLHDPDTAALVEREYEIFVEKSGENRSAIGVTAVNHHELGNLAWSRGEMNGENNASQASSELAWRSPPGPKHTVPWSAGGWEKFSLRTTITGHGEILAPAIFVAHWNAVAPVKHWPSETRTWVSGVSSWRHLAQRGLWVEGCADNLGFEFIRDTLKIPVLDLPALDAWQVLTYAQAVSGWHARGIPTITASYRLDYDSAAVASMARELSACSHFYWSSPAQYQAVEKWLPHQAQHACGPGKTAVALRDHGVHNLMVFPSRKIWQQWLA